MPPSFGSRSKKAVVLASLVMVGCSAIGPVRTAPPQDHPPTIDRAVVEATVLAGYLETLQRLAQGGPAEQAEILSGARRDFESAPTASHELRYAMILAMPNHPGTDDIKARQLLRELFATQETLLPAERAMAFVTLQNVDRMLLQAAEIQRLQAASADHSDQDRYEASLNHRLQNEMDDNARLHKELDDAHAKLDAIANIEKALSKPKTPGGTPP